MSKIFLFIFSILAIFVYVNKPICANSESCIKDLTGNYEGSDEPIVLADSIGSKNVLSEVTSQDKRIEVDLTNQMLYAYENNKVVMSFPVSTGKWGKTPTGTFRIWIKLRYTRMSGGVRGTGTYYNLPNVPYTMYFYNDKIPKARGFGLHGAYWHNNFGHPMSHGCVNISPENAGLLYNWADPPSVKNVTYATDENLGTEIVIYGSTPRE